MPIGKNQKFGTYHKHYDRYRINSYIFNGGGRQPSFDTVFWTKNRVVSEIAWIEGNDKGMVYNKNTSEESLALMPLVKEQLKELQKRFKRYQQQRVNEGHFRPAEMPNEMLNERLQLEARLDVYAEELNELKKRLKTFKEEEDQEHKQLLLAYGVSGSGSLHDGTLVELDGQTVSLNSNNMLVINDPLSPYDGLLIADYRECISKPWRIATEKLRNEKAALSRKLISQGLYNESFKTEWSELQKRIIEDDKLGDLFAIQLPNKPKIPKVPEHLKNYKISA